MKLIAEVSIDLQKLAMLGADRNKMIPHLLSSELALQIEDFLIRNPQAVSRTIDTAHLNQSSRVELHLLTAEMLNNVAERAARLAPRGP